MQENADLYSAQPAFIFIVDTCPYFVDGINHTLTSAGYHIAGNETSPDALSTSLSLLVASKPLAGIIGPNLETKHAFATCRWLRANVEHAVVMMISQHADEDIFKADAAYSGALACLSVEAPPELLLNVLPLVLAGQLLISNESQFFQVEPLSERELDVLKLLKEQKTVSEIASELVLSRGTVDKHKQNILKKLHVHRREDAIHRAIHLGWLP